MRYHHILRIIVCDSVDDLLTLDLDCSYCNCSLLTDNKSCTLRVIIIVDTVVVMVVISAANAAIVAADCADRSCGIVMAVQLSKTDGALNNRYYSLSVKNSPLI